MNQRTSIAVSCVTLVILCGAGWAADGPPAPGPKDRCATCGMFVAKYPAWLAAIEYADGSWTYFDGPKDLIKYRAREGATVGERAIWVTDYYTTRHLNAEDAVFVRGSDVTGPMGAELVPFASPELAESFRADHGGEPPLGFDEIDETVLRALE